MKLEASKLMAIYRLSRKAYRKYTYQIVGLTILGVISGVLEGVGVNALIPLFSLVMGVSEESKDVITKAIESFFVFFHIPLTVGTILLFVVLMFSLKALVLIIVQYIKVKITSDYEKNLRQKLFGNILKADWNFLGRQKLGHLETVVMIDVPESANLLHQISGAIMTTTGLLIYALVAINISSFVTAITLVAGGIVFLIFKPIAHRINLMSHERINLNKKTAHLIGESIAGVKTVKSLMVDVPLEAKGSGYFESMKKLMIKLSFYKSIPGALLPAISILFISLLFALSYKSAFFSLASLVAMVYLINKIFSYIQQFQNTLFTINSLVPHLQSVLRSEEKSFSYAENVSGKDEFVFNNSFTFNNVSFSYSENKKALSNLNFSIKKGDFIGVIGPSGGGKTTLVDLMLRLFKPSQGQVLIDGKDSQEFDLVSWRSCIGYISQEIFLLNDTISANIKFFNENISQDDIEVAARSAGVLDFVEKLPEKFETIVGERGVFLSAGQRQRIAIARILARKPQILILDEATSALDNESEARIQEVIKGLKGSVTVVAIAHRLSTVMDSDRLIVIHNGSIVEEGKPEDLIKNKDSYFFKVNQIASN